MKRAVLTALLAMTATAAADTKKASKDPEGEAKETAKAAVTGDDPIAAYFTQLESMRMIDTTTGSLASLKKELTSAETLLHDGAFVAAAVSLYTIVKSPRYAAFTEFVEFQNAEYDLGVALARAGSYGASLDALEVVMKRGVASPYWGPAHRRAVDIALETRDHAGVLARLEAMKVPKADLPESAKGERSYLRGRAAYDRNKLADAETELQSISKKSRMYSSAVYLRGVIRARRGDFRQSAAAMCEIAATPDTDKFSFVVDDRYFTIKDLARLGLGRIAHEASDYDDAYYHYFQIPDDSAYLPDALFEASWSMYQKRELPTSRDLVKEFLKDFPSSPLWPEASLLAGYIDLADCKFDESQKWYDDLVAKLQPIVDEIDKVRKDPELRKQLFNTAITRYRETKKLGTVVAAAKEKPKTALDDVLALLRLDPKFIRLNDALSGMRVLANNAPQNVRAWQNLGQQVTEKKVSAVTADKTLEQEQLADANAVAEDFRRLAAQVADAKGALARARHDKTITEEAAAEEQKRLDELGAKIEAARKNAVAAADTAAKAVTSQAAAGIKPMIEADVGEARKLEANTQALEKKLETTGDALAQAAIERLYIDVRKVLDKAKLGKVDAIIGQKRKLDIQVQDLAAGRMPEELIGRMWNASMIGDDEEYWPWQGEYWADEYKGFR